MRHLFPVLLVALLGQSASAAVITYSAVLDTITLPPNNPTTFVRPSSTPAFNATLTPADQLEVTFRAPAGQQFTIAAPPPGPGYVLQFGFGDAGGRSSPLKVSGTGVSYAFTGASGTLPVLGTPFRFFHDSLDNFNAIAQFSLLGAFSFESITMLFNVAPAFTESYTNFTPPLVQFYVQPTNAAGVVTLTPTAVPEPGTAGLALAALAAFGLLARKGR